MAVSITTLIQRDIVKGSQRQTKTDITMDDSYTANGEVVTATQLGLTYIDSAEAHIVTSGANSTGTHYSFDVDTDQEGGLLRAWDINSEIAGTTNLSDTIVRVVADGG